MSVEATISDVLVREGWPEFTNDPVDPGGPTKGGITLKDLADWRGHPCTIEDLQNLGEPEARLIYEKRYVVDYHFNEITDAWVQDFVVDTGVLQGQDEAAKMLQRVLGVKQDGAIGPITLRALWVAMAHPVTLRLALVRERMHLLLDDMMYHVPEQYRETTNLKYRHGWWNRVADFLERP
jgi:lysozyme family protein